MNMRIRVVSILISTFIFAMIILLVRRKKLREEFALIWIVAGVVIVTMATWVDMVSFVSRLTGILTPPSVIFVLGILFLVLINLQLSIKVSKNQDDIKDLAQKIALIDMGHDSENSRDHV